MSVRLFTDNLDQDSFFPFAVEFAVKDLFPGAEIQLPPGDFLTSYISNLVAQGENVDEDVLDRLRVQYGLDQPMYMQYLRWLWHFVF